MSTIKPGLCNVFLKKFDKPMILKYLKSIKSKEFIVDTADIDKNKHTTHAHQNFKPKISFSHQVTDEGNAKNDECRDINVIMK